LGGALGCSFQRLRFGHRRAVLFRCRDLHRIVSLLHTRDRQGTVPDDRGSRSILDRLLGQALFPLPAIESIIATASRNENANAW
jgi:hypothetical protein